MHAHLVGFAKDVLTLQQDMGTVLWREKWVAAVVEKMAPLSVAACGLQEVSSQTVAVAETASAK